MNVSVDDVVRRVVDDSVVAQHVRDCEIAVGRVHLGLVQGLVDCQFASGKCGEEAARPLDAGLDVGVVVDEQPVGGDRAGVDHRVARPAGTALEGEFVECLARRFDAHLLQHRVESAVGQCRRVGERLGDRLDGELDLVVADAVRSAVDGGDCDREQIGVGLGQVRDVVGDGSAALGIERIEDLGQIIADG
ncbi:Uncharacterised protein [Mycobacteroides abscessus subsp. abscessus]|nr:Uncharacterised protein [Mycobacteroides abscessus subsp. abscessus]